MKISKPTPSSIEERRALAHAVLALHREMKAMPLKRYATVDDLFAAAEARGDEPENRRRAEAFEKRMTRRTLVAYEKRQQVLADAAAVGVRLDTGWQGPDDTSERKVKGHLVYWPVAVMTDAGPFQATRCGIVEGIDVAGKAQVLCWQPADCLCPPDEHGKRRVLARGEWRWTP